MKTFLSLLMAIMFLGGQALAEESDICDSQIGAAYGLCNAYCTAMECASADPQANDIACDRVSSKYEQLTGNNLPCDTPPVTCPFWNAIMNFVALTPGCISTEDDLELSDPYSFTDQCQVNADNEVIIEVATVDDEVFLHFYANIPGITLFEDWTLLDAAEQQACVSNIDAHEFTISP